MPIILLREFFVGTGEFKPGSAQISAGETKVIRLLLSYNPLASYRSHPGILFIEYECYVIMKTLNHLARWAGGITILCEIYCFFWLVVASFDSFLWSFWVLLGFLTKRIIHASEPARGPEKLPKGPQRPPKGS